MESWPLFAAEGIMMGVGAFGPLALLTSLGVGVMVAGLLFASKLRLGVASVWLALLAFHVIQLIGTMVFHLRLGPLAAGREPTAPPVEKVECVDLAEPIGEVCVSGGTAE